MDSAFVGMRTTGRVLAMLGLGASSCQHSAPAATLRDTAAAHVVAIPASEAAPSTTASPPRLPAGFVYLDTIAPTIAVELRYAGHHNFVGRPIVGYEGKRAIMTRAAAEALAGVEADLRKKGLRLKVYDAYRPQRAVDDFVRWAEQPDDTAMRPEFYPRVDKARLFDDGYIARRSGHTRGSTVDLTIIPAEAPAQNEYTPGDPLVDGTQPQGVRFNDNSIDMGTGFDVFDPLAHTDSPHITGMARKNRDLLRDTMRAHGFVNLPTEWWHYTLAPEPFPDTYFDFEVR